MPGKNTIRPCEADDCPERVRTPALFCPWHWAFVPRDLQYGIADAVAVVARGGSRTELDRLVTVAREKVKKSEG